MVANSYVILIFYDISSIQEYKSKHIEDEDFKPTVKINNQEGDVETSKIMEQEVKIRNENSRIKIGNIQD